MREVLFNLVAAAVATLGFGVLFRAERRALLPGALVGGVGYAVYSLLEQASGQAAAGALAAGLLVGMASEIIARRMKMPTTVFVTMGIIPMVPGYGLYETMLSIVEKDYATALSMGAQTMLTAGAIAMSLGLSAIVCRTLRRLMRRRA